MDVREDLRRLGIEKHDAGVKVHLLHLDSVDDLGVHRALRTQLLDRRLLAELDHMTVRVVNKNSVARSVVNIHRDTETRHARLGPVRLRVLAEVEQHVGGAHN